MGSQSWQTEVGLSLSRALYLGLLPHPCSCPRPSEPPAFHQGLGGQGGNGFRRQEGREVSLPALDQLSPVAEGAIHWTLGLKADLRGTGYPSSALARIGPATPWETRCPHH